MSMKNLQNREAATDLAVFSFEIDSIRTFVTWHFHILFIWSKKKVCLKYTVLLNYMKHYQAILKSVF